MWSCLATIFSCTWVAIHPNIPCPKTREANGWVERCIWNPLLSFAEHRLPLFVCALLVPEYVLAWAIRQFLRARKIAKENKSEFKAFGCVLSTASVLSSSSLDVQWSMTHGFFITMGGFHLFERSSKEMSNDRRTSQEDDKPLHPLGENDLRNCDGYESFEFIMPTKAEIMDKGKSDWLAKSLVLLQTSWFVMQCIARAVERLPVTHLEIVTLAYAALNFVIYAFWWNKPLNVNRPIRVFQKSEPRETQPQIGEPIPEGLVAVLKFIVGLQDEDVDLSHEDRVPTFWANTTGEQAIADIIVLAVGVCFGAIHCIAWVFSFPTHTELLIWRISSVVITAIPIYISLMAILSSWPFSVDFAIVSVLPAGVLYIIARAVTLVLAFISLRDLPPGAYETVHWTTFIPHV